MLKAAIKNAAIEKRGQLKEDELLQEISKQTKQHKESIIEFEKGRRQDLVEKEKAELKILQNYMPPQLSEDNVKEIVKKSIDAIGAKGFKDMGRVMKLIMPEVTGRADGKLVSQIVKEKLSN